MQNKEEHKKKDYCEFTVILLHYLFNFLTSSSIGLALLKDWPMTSPGTIRFKKKAETKPMNKKPVPTKKAKLIPSKVA